MRTNIEAERIRNQIPRKELVKTLGIVEKTYYNWINETTDIPGTKLLMMAKLFDVGMEYLMESHPARSKPNQEAV